MFRSTSTMCAFLLSIAGIILLGFSAKAATIEEKAKSARAYAGKGPTIKCGPEDSGDIMSPAAVLTKIKSGSTLILTPGDYKETTIRITASKVLITGDGSGRFCDVTLEITGRDCVVKGVWVYKIVSSNDLIVVDSVINSIRAGGLTDRKSTQYFYNTCMTHMSTPFHDMKVIMKKCTVAGGSSGIYSGVNTRFTLSDCLITATKVPFHFNEECKGGKNKVTLEHCRIYGKSGTIASRGYSEGEGKIAIDLKQLNRIANVFCKKDVQILKPVFLSSKYNDLGQFIQSDDSPTKDVGVNPKFNPLLSKYLDRDGKATKPKATHQPVPPRKIKPPPHPKPPPKRVAPSPPQDDSDIGGIPAEPD